MLTYDDLRREGVLSSRLLSARLHFAARPTHPHLESLANIVTALGGEYIIGSEPGGLAFADDTPFVFLRTSATSRVRVSVRSLADGGECIYPFGFRAQALASGDVLIAKDGPVGQVGILRWRDRRQPMISSGLIRLRLPRLGWYYLGLLRYGPFTSDIDVLTPGGATFRHAGKERILSARLPRPGHRPDLEDRIGTLAKLISDLELRIERRFRLGLWLLDRWAATTGVRVAPRTTSRSVDEYVAAGRLDAGLHGAMSSDFAVRVGARSSQSLEDLVASGSLSRHRGQNLQVTAIGFSEKHDDPRLGSYRLVEPNFIGRDMSLPRSRWLWCPRPLATLSASTIVMSSEGTVGNLTIMPPSVDRVPTISNIHATILDWVGPGNRSERNAWLAFNLGYLREKGWLDAVSAGGQGGSLGFNYHRFVPMLDFDPTLAASLGRLVSDPVDVAVPPNLSTSPVEAIRDLMVRLSASGIWAMDEWRAAAEDGLRALVRNEFPELFA